MDTPQTNLDQQIMQQRLKEFLPAFDQLQKEKGVVVVPVIRQGEFGELIPDFYFMSREEAEKRLQAKQQPQGDTTNASNV